MDVREILLKEKSGLMNRGRLLEQFKNNNALGILQMQFSEHSDIRNYNSFMHAIDALCNERGILINQYIDHTLMMIRNKYEIIFVFNKEGNKLLEVL